MHPGPRKASSTLQHDAPHTKIGGTQSGSAWACLPGGCPNEAPLGPRGMPGECPSGGPRVLRAAGWGGRGPRMAPLARPRKKNPPNRGPGAGPPAAPSHPGIQGPTHLLTSGVGVQAPGRSRTGSGASVGTRVEALGRTPFKDPSPSAAWSAVLAALGQGDGQGLGRSRDQGPACGRLRGGARERARSWIRIRHKARGG